MGQLSTKVHGWVVLPCTARLHGTPSHPVLRRVLRHLVHPWEGRGQASVQAQCGGALLFRSLRGGVTQVLLCRPPPAPGLGSFAPRLPRARVAVAALCAGRRSSGLTRALWPCALAEMVALKVLSTLRRRTRHVLATGKPPAASVARHALCARR